jgi:hypothetical protein
MISDVSIVPPKIPYGGFSPVRLQGIGKAVASALWHRFPGSRELQVHERNEGAAKFWKSCIKEYASGSFGVEEISTDNGQRLVYRVSISRPDTASGGKEEEGADLCF